MPHTIPFVWPFYESFDVGADTRTSVNENDYQVPFRFNGTIDKLTVKLGPSQLMSETDKKKAAEAVAKAND